MPTQQPHYLYIITKPEDKILHHIIWNQNQHPFALFAIVAMNPAVDTWLEKENVERSLVHGDLPPAPHRLETFHHIMQGPFFQNFYIPDSHLSFMENIPVDRLLQFFQHESRHAEQEVLGKVNFDQMICSLDMDHPTIHFLVKKAEKLGIPTTAIQCDEIRTREMLDITPKFHRYIVDLDEDRNFLVHQLGIDPNCIEVVGKMLVDSLQGMKNQMRITARKTAQQLQLTDVESGIFMHYIRRHNWEIRKMLKVLKRLNAQHPNRLILFVNCQNQTDEEEFQILFATELKDIPWRLIPTSSDISVLNHCFPLWLGFRYNRDLDIAAWLGQRIVLFDPYDFNCTSRMGIDETVWKVARHDDQLLDILQNLQLEVVK